MLQAGTETTVSSPLFFFFKGKTELFLAVFRPQLF